MNEKAIEYFEFHRKIFCEDHLKICPKDSIAYQATLKEKEFYDLAIKALKRDSILDKIKAEIEALPKTYPFVNHIDMYVKVSDVTKIIDKYKAGSEQ